MSITDNLKNIQDRINAAAERAGRNPSEIRLVTVSKTYPLPRIIEAMNAGTLTFGESKVQEAKEKIEELQGQRGKGAEAQSNVEWHLIGNLQKNKAKHAVQLFDLIHTVDTISLAEELNRQAEKIQKVQRILIQVKLSDEETKSGVQEENLVPMLKAVSAMKNLKIEGL
ncbi:YggS family pyridoxal phosphate-dependent enzyme, partial [bacterium]|nr:YggS family pyridoxal phosphate-dependent enzyme [bacterium]